MAIFSAIATGIAALFGLGSLATSLIAAGLSMAANLALKYLFRPKQRKYAAVQGQMQLGGDVAASTVFGMSKVKGHRVYYAKWGAGNKYNGEVLALANGWCDGLEPEIHFYGEKHVLTPQTVTGNEAARYAVAGFGSLISIRFYDGRAGQGPDDELVAATVSSGNPWHATSVGAGICYVVVVREYDSEKFPNGRPEFDFILRGLREYDPRQDSTVAGGSGAQRLNDASTWVFTQNPAIHRLNYLLGVKGLISGRALVGVGRDINQIDLPSHMAAATVCDTTRTVGARTIKTYACSLWAQAEDDHIEILSEFEDAMAGYAANMSGLAGVIAGAPQISVMTLTGADIRIDDGRDVQFRKSAFESVNILSGQFTSPESNWNPQSLKVVTSNGDVAADGRKRPASNDFLQVSDPDIGQYLLNIRYRQNRKAGSASLPVSRRAGAKLSLGDWIVWNGKTWLVTGREFDERMRFRIRLAETGADIYSETGITAGPVIIAPNAPANPSLVSTIAGFGVAAGMMGDAGGVQRPTLQLTWTAPSDPSITQVRIFYRIAGTVEEFEAVSTAPESGLLRTTANVLPGKTYEARATITTVPDRLKSFTPWQSSGVTAAGNLWVSLADHQSDAIDLWKRITAQLNDVKGKIERIAMDAAIGTGKNIVQNAAVVRTQNAYAVSLSELTASVDVIDGTVTALASAVTAVEAMTEAGTASGLIGWEAVSGGAGVSARLAIEGRVTTGGSFTQGGLYMDILSGGATRIVFDFSKFIILGPTGSALAPFVVDGANVIIDNAFIRNLTAANITAGAITADRLAADVATFVNAQISSATIDYAQIDSVVINEGVIAAGAVTSSGDMATTTPSSDIAGNWVDVGASVTIESPSGNPVLFYWSLFWHANVLSSGGSVGLRILRNGSVIKGPYTTVGTGSQTINVGTLEMLVVGTGTHVFQVQSKRSSANSTTFSIAIIATCNKK